MPPPSEKKIWDEVFNGNVHSAINWTQTQRAQQKQAGHHENQNPIALYVEPSLNSTNGHQLSLAGCYKQLLTRMGYQTIIAHAQENSLQPKQDWRPYFLVKHHTMAYRSIHSPKDLKNVEHYFFDEFAQIIEEYDPKVCIFATIRFTNIVAAVKALATHNIQNAIFGVMEAVDVPDCKDPGIVQSAFSRAARLLQEHGLAHMFIAETDYVKTFLLGYGFQEANVKVFPYVAAKLITDIPNPVKKDAGNVRIGYLGDSRPVRHPELIADLLVSEPLPNSIDVHVQLSLNYIQNKRGKELCKKISEMHRNGSITLYPPTLSSQQYRSLFCSLDFIILPYGERYRQIGSGIFFEAIFAGVIPILPANSKMHDVYVSLGGAAPCFETLSADAIRDAIIDGVSQYSTLRKTAVTIREKWQQHPSSYDQWQAEITRWLPSHHV